MAQIKWIGFDMDDCLANVTPVYYFVKAYGAKELAPLLLEADKVGQIWLLRSNMQLIVDEVSKAVKEGNVFGAFLYSNNGSENMVELVMNMLNLMSNGVNPFKFGFHRGFVARTGQKVKTYEDICNCLHVADMPLPSNPDCLAFFDDKLQILRSEITLYRRVRRYRGYTPVQRIAEVLENHVGEELFDKAVLSAFQEEFQREERVKSRDDQNPFVFIDTIQKLCAV
jgi:hypothetical protein